MTEAPLTINNSTTSILDTTVCDVFTWNGDVYDSTGIYSYFTSTTAGCDSIITLDLTIQNTTIFDTYSPIPTLLPM